MQRVVKIKLQAEPDKKAILQDTVVHYAACFNTVASLAWEKRLTNGVKLHHETYYPLRAEHPTLPAQLVVSAREKAREAVKATLKRRKRGKKATCPRSRYGAIRYDARSYSFCPLAQVVPGRADRGEVSLATTGGRLRLPASIPAYFEPYISQATDFDSADLIYYPHTGGFWLHLVVTLPDPETTETDPPGCCKDNTQVVGVDVGISRIAVSSHNHFFDGKRVKEHTRKLFRLRRALQAKGTRSARRHLQKLRRRENRLRADVNHRVSKWLVEMLPAGSVIVMENLTDIRERVRARRKQRRELHNWPFAQFQRFVRYKAEARGIRVEFADAHYTSQSCSRCGHIAHSNRKYQSWFFCNKCGYQLNADLNAARNLALRATRAQSGPPVLVPRPGTSWGRRLGPGPVNRPIVSLVDAEAPLGAN